VTRTWTLIGPDGKPFQSTVPGTLGGHRKGRIYGRLDCPAALRAIERGGYVSQRVFFLNEHDAKAAGYRPCAVCMPTEYARYARQRQIST
jgi:methylphosphotriester-DNA--protein-cysteine methyltransferase